MEMSYTKMLYKNDKPSYHLEMDKDSHFDLALFLLYPYKETNKPVKSLGF